MHIHTFSSDLKKVCRYKNCTYMYMFSLHAKFGGDTPFHSHEKRKISFFCRAVRLFVTLGSEPEHRIEAH